MHISNSRNVHSNDKETVFKKYGGCLKHNLGMHLVYDIYMSGVQLLVREAKAETYFCYSKRYYSMCENEICGNDLQSTLSEYWNHSC